MSNEETIPVVEYQITIDRRTPNPSYEPLDPMRHSYGEREPQFLDRAVTTATLTPEQWTKVQAAIVEVLR